MLNVLLYYIVPINVIYFPITFFYCSNFAYSTHILSSHLYIYYRLHKYFMILDYRGVWKAGEDFGRPDF